MLEPTLNMPWPQVPNLHAMVALLAMVLTLILFSLEKLRLEVTALSLLAAIPLGFALFPFAGINPLSFFSGLAHEALISVCALLVVGQGLVRTGALEPLGRGLAQLWQTAPAASLLATLIIGGVLSAFVNNTPIVVLLLPLLISVCLRTNKSPAKVLMPMGFATLVGGMATTIGTSTNLLVVSIAQEQGLARFGLFDFALPAVLAAGVAVIYLWLIAPRLLPARQSPLADASPRQFAARLHISSDSPIVGKTLAEARALAGPTFHVLRLLRDGTMLVPLPDVLLRRDDQIRLQDTPQNLKAFEQALGCQLFDDDTANKAAEATPTQDDQALAELAVVSGSSLDQANLARAQFLQRFQLIVLALHRAGKDIWRPGERIQEVTLRPGDVLLVQGPKTELRQLKQSTEFLVLDNSIDLPRTAKAPPALVIVLAVVGLAATGVLPIAVAAVAGAGLMVLSGCLSIGQAVRAISPSVYFVVAASLALGSALLQTGATDYLTQVFLYATQNASPTVMISALMLLLAVLTNVVSNNAAAVIGTPIAMGIASQLQLPAEPFVLAVLFGANMSYATPMAYKTNLLVMSAGNYQFIDFVKVGLPLTLLMWFTLTWLLDWLYLS